jgi:predicted nucleic acid-binding protein
MKIYLLDTEFASAFFDKGDKDHQKAFSFVQNAAERGDHIYLSCISHGEIRYGLALYPNLDQSRSAEVEKSLKAFSTVKYVQTATSPHYASIRTALMHRFCPRNNRGKYKKKRPETLVDPTTAQTLGIQENDLWIASIAEEHQMELVSSDKMNCIKQVWPSLKLVKWK